MEKEKYESPFTKKTRVNLESGICASSRDVVTEDENPTIDINRQEEGGSFKISSWDD